MTFISFLTKKTFLPLDHQVDRTVQSNRHLEYRDLLQPRLYREEFPKWHYKIGKRLLFVSFAFASPENENDR